MRRSPSGGWILAAARSLNRLRQTLRDHDVGRSRGRPSPPPEVTQQQSLIVLIALEVFYWWDKASPYRLWLRRLSRGARRSAPAADEFTLYRELRPVATELYIVSGAFALAAILATGALWRHVLVFRLLFTVVASYRLLDILIYQLRILLDRHVRGWQNAERVLVIVFVNVVELAMAIGIFLLAWTSARSSLVFFQGFAIITFNADVGTSLAEEAIKTCGYIAALAIIGGALAGTWNLLGAKLQPRTAEEDERAVMAQREAIDPEARTQPSHRET